MTTTVQNLGHLVAAHLTEAAILRATHLFSSSRIHEHERTETFLETAEREVFESYARLLARVSQTLNVPS